MFLGRGLFGEVDAEVVAVGGDVGPEDVVE